MIYFNYWCILYVQLFDTKDGLWMKQIIALGGGGFSMEPENPLLDDYILAQANVEKPKICFLPTASGDSADYVQRFYHAFEAKECEPSHLSLFKPPARDLEGVYSIKTSYM